MEFRGKSAKISQSHEWVAPLRAGPKNHNQIVISDPQEIVPKKSKKQSKITKNDQKTKANDQNGFDGFGLFFDIFFVIFDCVICFFGDDFVGI